MQEQKIRTTNRKLLIFYDIFFYLITSGLVFLFTAPLTNNIRVIVYGLKYVLPLICLTVALRLLFSVYRRIWRYSNVGNYARLLAADCIAGGIYVCAAFLIRLTLVRFPVVGGFYISVRLPLVIAAANLIVAVLIRIAYYYLYAAAKGTSRSADFFKRTLTKYCLVDFDSTDGGVLTVVLESANRSSEPINDILPIFYSFAVVGKVTSVKRVNAGYINRTYYVETLSANNHVHKYILQRINTKVFLDVDALMENFALVTAHLQSKFILPGHTERGSITSVKTTRDGVPYLRDPESGCWRVTTFFENSYSMDVPDSAETMYKAGSAFGKFIMDMSDVDVASVKEVIPNFHNTKNRYEDLKKAIELDPVGRVSEVGDEIAFFHERRDKYGLISDKLESGELPLRICHNDTNLNNILFDRDTNEAVAVIDLDTVMPSTPLYDYGDSMRSGTNTARDDEKDLSLVKCNLEFYEAYARGWLESCGKLLTREELNMLPYASLIITSEDAIRFLTDYINGDTYFNIFYSEQNLDRSRTQIKLVRDMEEHLPQIKQILLSIYEELGLESDLTLD